MPKKPLILCVDDEWNQLEGRKMLLEESGCKVLASTSGEEAVRRRTTRERVGIGRCVCVQERILRAPVTDRRTFARSAFSFYPFR
jgi:CheY-like chemotaxis protein